MNAGEACTLLVTYEPTNGDSKTAEIIIQSNDPSTPSISIDLTGIIKDPFISSVSTFDLGTTEIGGLASTKELIVTNTGAAPLDISGISGLTSADFSQVNTCNTPITTNSTCSISITYTPSTLGAAADILTITSNDPANPSINVNITGFGVDNIANDPVIDTVSNFDVGITEIGGPPTTKELIITNRGMAPLEISDITALTNADFSQVNNCISSSPIATDSTCRITITYTPSTLGAATDILTITSNDPANPSININITGFGVDNVIEDPFISTVSVFDLGASQINGTPSIKELIVTNKGLAPLVISDISGLTGTGFDQVNNCTGSGFQLSLDATCSIFIKYTTSILGPATDILTITSNDPANPSINININGFGDYDTDGILSNIELSGPNSGDANNDGISDDVQNNVATLIALNSNYITFISDNSLILDAETAFADVVLIDIIPSGKPENATFDYGLYGYSITLPAGDSVNMANIIATQ